MGIYLNPGARQFQEARDFSLYVDKSGMIGKLNRLLGTPMKYVCISRPRRFGKSMAVGMISAYYDRTVDAQALFAGLEAAEDPSFDRYRGRFDVLRINMQEFLSEASSMADMIASLQEALLWELLQAYPDFAYQRKDRLRIVMNTIYANTGRAFVVLIDEWDCIFREYKEAEEAQRQYLDFLRDMLKDKEYIALAYMTGILPIKKYGTHSALNMFTEYSIKDTADRGFFGNGRFAVSFFRSLRKKDNTDEGNPSDIKGGFFTRDKLCLL